VDMKIGYEVREEVSTGMGRRQVKAKNFTNDVTFSCSVNLHSDRGIPQTT
jgi:hypothetical protein